LIFGEIGPFSMELAHEKLPAGYYETPLDGPTGETFMGVWLPLKAPAPPLGFYKSQINLGKKMTVQLGMVMKTGLPSWLPCLACMPTVETLIPTASPVLGAATPDMVAEPSKLKGLVVYLHGLSDGPPSIAHLFEKLAALGFVCAAPSFADDDSNNVKSALSSGHQNLELVHTQREVRTRNAIAALQATYGRSLPLMLIGYSTGTDTMRRMHDLACPRIYMGGPGWLEYATGTPISTPPPGGPTLQLCAIPDEIMAMMKFTADDATRLTGFPLQQGGQQGGTVIVPAESVAAELRAGKRHLRVDYEGWVHASFKHPPFGASEDFAWSQMLCGLNIWELAKLGKKEEDAGPSAEVVQERADAYVDVVASWLLAARTESGGE
jgi:hypothetical protein